MYKEEFTLRLGRLRSEMSVSARDMSLSLGQNPGYISNIENGKALPSMAMFFYICDYLHISPAEFFTTENSSPQKVKNVIKNLSQLDDEALDSIAVIIEKLSKK